MFDDEVTINPSGRRDHVVADIGVLNSAIAGKFVDQWTHLTRQCGVLGSFNCLSDVWKNQTVAV